MSIVIKVTVTAEVRVKDEEEMKQFKEEFSLNWYGNEILVENYEFESWEE
jgi:hypothetical protein